MSAVFVLLSSATSAVCQEKFAICIRIPIRAQGEKFGLAYVKLGTTDLWVGTRTGAGVTATL
jgi:hypothetical protein